MKKALLALVLNLMVFHFVYAQTEAEKKLKQELWDAAPPEFKSTKVPEKWANESAVVLALDRSYTGDFTSKVTGLTSVSRFYIEKLTIHYRIKLQDKAAVKDFSEISFDAKTVRTNLFGKANSYRIMGIKVIKANGSEKEVDLTNAVKADAGSAKDLKIPIPNLEPGDIVDYFIAFRDESTTMPNFGDEQILEGKYPVVTQTISFKIPHQINFYSYPYNGSPEFGKQVIEKDILYTLKDNMRDKAPDLLWAYDYQTAPHFRYKITNLEEKPDPKRSAEKLLDFFNNNMANIGFMIDYMEGNFKKEKDPQKIANEIYCLLRNPIYMEAYFNIKQGEPLNADYPTDLFFLLVDKYLSKYKINHEIVLAPSREYGPFPRLVNFSSCDLMIRVNVDPPIYIPRPTPFAIPNEVPYIFEGVEAVRRPSMIQNRVLDVTTAEQNSSITKINVSLVANDFTKINLKRSILAKGHNKDYHQYMVFTNYDYLKEYDQAKYQVQSSNLLRGLIKNYNKEKIKFEQRLTQDYTERDERIKNSLERDLDAKVSEYKNLSIKSIGMWHDAPNTEYSDEFISENLTKKAGPNTIIEIGKLIEKQTEITDEQKSRTRDIHMSYARSFVHEIVITIPDGYKMEGYENLNKKSESAMGGFVSSATLEGKTLTIKTKKYYNKNYYTAAEWPKIVNFLNTAVEFYNAKLLLKKA